MPYHFAVVVNAFVGLVVGEVDRLVEQSLVVDQAAWLDASVSRNDYFWLEKNLSIYQTVNLIYK